MIQTRCFVLLEQNVREIFSGVNMFAMAKVDFRFRVR